MPLELEDFDTGLPLAHAAPAEPTPDWVAGHAEGWAEGQAAARAAAASEQAALSAALVRRFEDAAWTYAEAREAILDSLAPLFATLLDRILPAFATEALVPRLVEALVEAARQDAGAPVTIHVAPARVEAVRRALPTAGAHATVAADPALGPDAARIAQAGRETALDIDACLAALREACGAAVPIRARSA